MKKLTFFLVFIFLLSLGSTAYASNIFQNPKHIKHVKHERNAEGFKPPKPQLDSRMLNRAIRDNDLEMVSNIIESGLMNPYDLEPIDKLPPLAAAAIYGRIEIVEILIERYMVDINTVDGRGSTALLYASAFGHADIAQLLIDHGANINAQQTSNGRTAAHHAALAGNVEVLILLRLNGANFSISDMFGKTPLDFVKITRDAINIENKELRLLCLERFKIQFLENRNSEEVRKQLAKSIDFLTNNVAGAKFIQIRSAYNKE